jgi:hypothetical protein
MIIGLVPFAEAESTDAITIPSLENLMKGTSLSVPEPEGGRIDNLALAGRISEELGRTLGGWFDTDLVPFIRLYDGLISSQTVEEYRLSGMTITRDQPREAFYFLAFEMAPWQVQAVGEEGVLHAIYIGRSLTSAEATGPGGHPVYRPLGAIQEWLSQAAPKLADLPLTDHSAEHTVNVFDTYLVSPGLIVKAGVRERLMKDGQANPGEQAYVYGIRINLDLRMP